MKTFRKLTRHVLATALILSPLCAQDSLAKARLAQDGTSPSGFVIEGTTIPVASNGPDLKALFEAQKVTNGSLYLKVRDVGTTKPTLLIESAKLEPRTLEVTRLALGAEAKFIVFTPAGNYAWIWVAHPDDSRFLPLGGYGAWFLGDKAFLLAATRSDSSGNATAGIKVPNVPTLVGLSVVAQAVHGNAGGLELTHPAAQTVQAR